jgi:hypothetical protein
MLLWTQDVINVVGHTFNHAILLLWLYMEVKHTKIFKQWMHMRKRATAKE